MKRIEIAKNYTEAIKKIAAWEQLEKNAIIFDPRDKEDAENFFKITGIFIYTIPENYQGLYIYVEV